MRVSTISPATSLRTVCVYIHLPEYCFLREILSTGQNPKSTHHVFHASLFSLVAHLESSVDSHGEPVVQIVIDEHLILKVVCTYRHKKLFKIGTTWKSLNLGHGFSIVGSRLSHSTRNFLFLESLFKSSSAWGMCNLAVTALTKKIRRDIGEVF